MLYKRKEFTVDEFFSYSQRYLFFRCWKLWFFMFFLETGLYVISSMMQKSSLKALVNFMTSAFW